MPLFPTPTIHVLKLVFCLEQSLKVWNILGHNSLSSTHVKPLPSWWHLPSDAVTTAIAFVLTFYVSDPVSSMQEVIHIRVETRRPDPDTTNTLAEAFCFSAGS